MTLEVHDTERAILEAVAAEAAKLNAPAYLIGGYVRDKLLNRRVTDMDIVCVGDGIQLARATAQRFDPAPKVSVFKNFGTAMFRFQGLEIEFVCARKESYHRNSRQPEVVPGTLEDDQSRRDFTVNALSVHLDKIHFGQVIDPFDGLNDLERRILRTPLDPDITFSDDPLRMMRAIRFAAQLQFRIAPDTLAAITRNTDRIEIVSQERITGELNKIILTDKPSIGFQLLFETGLLRKIFPEMANLHGVDIINGMAHKDNFFHTLKVLDNLARTSNDLWLRWAAALHDIAKPHSKRFHQQTGWTFHGHDAIGARMVPDLFRKLKLPLNDKMKFVQKLVLLHLRPISLVNSQVTDSAVRRLLFEGGADLDNLMLLCEADITSSNKAKVKTYLKNFELVRKKLKEVEDRDHLRTWQPPISGKEIMEVFELKPSRAVGEIKEAIKEAILDGEIPNERRAAYHLMVSKGKELGLTVAKPLAPE